MQSFPVPESGRSASSFSVLAESEAPSLNPQSPLGLLAPGSLVFLGLVRVSYPFCPIQTLSLGSVCQILGLDLGAYAEEPLIPLCTLPFLLEQTPDLKPIFRRKVTNPSSVSSLALRYITELTILIGLGYKDLQAPVYFHSFKLCSGASQLLLPSVSPLDTRANEV